jgi:hypothetical protein
MECELKSRILFRHPAPLSPSYLVVRIGPELFRNRCIKIQFKRRHLLHWLDRFTIVRQVFRRRVENQDAAYKMWIRLLTVKPGLSTVNVRHCVWMLSVSLCLHSKQPPIPYYIVHYFWPEPSGPWSKEVHYMWKGGHLRRSLWIRERERVTHPPPYSPDLCLAISHLISSEGF